MSATQATQARHVAIIMDGNGRWAKKRGLPRVMGHKVGVEAAREIVEAAAGLGIEALTLYTFSTENWQRPMAEVQALMGLLKSYLESQLAAMTENNIRLMVSGETERLPGEVLEVVNRVCEATASNSGMVLNLALSYGSRSEIVRAVRQIAASCLEGDLTPDAIDEETIRQHLYTASLPDPDLVIRTGGEQRLSNFLLWQCSYSEIYFTEVLWPDFRKQEFLAALDDYSRRQRRFGKTSEQIETIHPGCSP